MDIFRYQKLKLTFWLTSLLTCLCIITIKLTVNTIERDTNKETKLYVTVVGSTLLLEILLL